MYHGKHLAKKSSGCKLKRCKTGALILSLLLLVTVAVGGTAAYLLTKTEPVTNTFTPSHVTCEVTESFDGTVKKNVNVTNTGDTEAYIRVKLVTYRINDAGQHIGGAATIPSGLELGENWVERGGYYYYTKPVAPNGSPDKSLIGESGINLISYTDADGGKQVIEVMAEAIQSSPAKAVGESWGVSISEGSITAYDAG
ncbi:MAG: hypothetical protein MSF32_07465 [Dysosmobacter sp.]|nr:hypothetical protein [Dysosmobacter sp.]